jgi:oligoendopeptidase F
MPTLLPRSKVKKNQTWNAESVFASPEAFDVEVQSLIESLAEIKKYQGCLGDNPDIFIEAMNIMEVLARRAAKVQVYAAMSSAVDTANQEGAAMNGKAMSALAQVGAAASFVDPELFSIGEAKLRQWLSDDPRIFTLTTTRSNMPSESPLRTPSPNAFWTVHRMPPTRSVTSISSKQVHPNRQWMCTRSRAWI